MGPKFCLASATTELEDHGKEGVSQYALSYHRGTTLSLPNFFFCQTTFFLIKKWIAFWIQRFAKHPSM